MTGAEDTPGIISLHGTSGGLDNDQDWYIMYQSDDTLLAYYCGNTLTWHFEGALVMSKVKGISSKDEPYIKSAIESLGISYDDDMCVLDPDTACPAGNVFLQ